MSKEYELVFAGKEKGFQIDAEIEDVVVDGIPGVNAIPLCKMPQTCNISGYG